MRVDRHDLDQRVKIESALLRSRAPGERITPLHRTPGELRFPAAVSQEGMWREVTGKAGPPLAIVTGLRVHGLLDTSLLAEAWNAVVARHETLRTALVPDGGRLTQVISESLHVPLPIAPLTDPAEFDDMMRQEVDRPFPLDRPPLARLRLFRLASDDHLALLMIHHIISEARSFEVVVRDLAAFYIARAAGGEPELPELPVQWSDFAAWHRQRLAGPRGSKLIEYWSNRLSGAVPAILPTDLEPPPGQSPYDAERGDMLVTPLSPELFVRVSELAKTYRTTLYTVGLVAFTVLLARYSGQQDIGVNAPISYRDRTELHDLVADFSNDVIVRIDLSANPTFDELIDTTRKKLSEDFAHHDLPPHLLAPHLDDPKLISRMAHVQFTAEREPDLVERVGELRIERLKPLVRQYVLRPLSVRLRHDDRSAILIVRYRTNRFTAARVAKFVAAYFDLMVEMTTHPGRQVLGSGNNSLNPFQLSRGYCEAPRGAP